jgi:hypothetical protein
LALALGCEAFCLWLLLWGFGFGFGLSFSLWALALGFLVWEAFGREKNY